jgi:hypothetical protein
MGNATRCLFCDHDLDGRSKKFCTTCLPPYGEWDDKRGYTNRYNELSAMCGQHPGWGFPSCKIPKSHGAYLRPRRPPKPHGCDRCGVMLSTSSKNCEQCTRALRSESARRAHARRAANRPPDWKPSNNYRRQEALRRRRKAATRSGTRPTVAKLAERDGWRCHLCGKRIDPALTGTRSKYKASIDHLVPLSANGLDEMWNCKLAHLRCNAKRGAAGDVQLLLAVDH